MSRIVSLWWRLVAFGFRLLYNELAFTYDWVSWIVSLGEWQHWQRAALRYLPAPEAGTVLELAHGTGDLQLDLMSAGYRTVGYDLSPYMGLIAQRKSARQGFSPCLVRGDARFLPFATDAIASVVCTFPTNFILDSATLTQVYRVLKPGGVFVIVPNGVLTGGGIIQRVLELLYQVTGQRNDDLPFDPAGLFGVYGFIGTERVEVPCRYSKATVIILRKPDK